MRGIKAVAPGRPSQRDRARDRVLREAIRLRGRPGLHRARHRTRLPLGPDRPALRRAPATITDRAGMTFTIEPMLNLGTHDWEIWDDGWTVVTADRRRSAQFEHTLLVTEDGAEILTLP